MKIEVSDEVRAGERAYRQALREGREPSRAARDLHASYEMARRAVNPASAAKADTAYRTANGRPPRPSLKTLVHDVVRARTRVLIRTGEIKVPSWCEWEEGCAESKLEVHHVTYDRADNVKFYCSPHHDAADRRDGTSAHTA